MKTLLHPFATAAATLASVMAISAPALAQSLVKDINTQLVEPSSSPGGGEVMGGALYFAAEDEFNGPALWKTDGSSGAELVKSFSDRPTNMVAMGSVLFFTASDVADNVELWRTDGTLSGTSMVRDISAQSSNPTNLTVAFGGLYFTADDGQNGRELWKNRWHLAGHAARP